MVDEAVEDADCRRETSGGARRISVTDKKQHMICMAVGLACMLTVFELVNQIRAMLSGDNRNLEAWSKAIDIGYDKKHISWLKSDFKVMTSGLESTMSSP